MHDNKFPTENRISLFTNLLTFSIISSLQNSQEPITPKPISLPDCFDWYGKEPILKPTPVPLLFLKTSSPRQSYKLYRQLDLTIHKHLRHQC